MARDGVSSPIPSQLGICLISVLSMIFSIILYYLAREAVKDYQATNQDTSINVYEGSWYLWLEAALDFLAACLFFLTAYLAYKQRNHIMMLILSVIEGVCGCLICCNLAFSIAGAGIYISLLSALKDFDCGTLTSTTTVLNGTAAAAPNDAEFQDCIDAKEHQEALGPIFIVFLIGSLIILCCQGLCCLFGSGQTMKTGRDIEQGAYRRGRDDYSSDNWE